MSVTGKTLIDEFVKDWRIGKVGAATAAGSTTTVVDGSARFKGPFAGNEWARGDPIRITGADTLSANNRTGEESLVDAYAPATGTFTVTPALTGAPGAGAPFVIVRRKYVDSVARLYEALSRGMNRWARRRMRIPLTYVTDGDLLGSAVATYWTGTNATPTYSDLSHPNGFHSRVLNIVTSAAGGYAVPAQIPCHPADVWDFAVWMRAAAASSTAELIIRDITNGAVITPTFISGAATSSSRAFVLVRGFFTIPTGCYLWQPRLSGQENPATVQFGPFIAAPQGAQEYTLQAYADNEHELGNFQGAIWPAGTDVGPEGIQYVPRRYGVEVEHLGFGLSFQFREVPEFPVYYEGLLGYASMSAETDSTHCPQNLALAAMAYEFWPSLADAHRDAKGQSPYDTQARRAREEWAEFGGNFGPSAEPTVRSSYGGAVVL